MADGIVCCGCHCVENSTVFSQTFCNKQLQQALSLKEKGNDYIMRNQYRKAKKKYHSSILLARGLTNQPTIIGSRGRIEISEELNTDVEQVLFSVYNNLAACCLKQRQWEKVIQYSAMALEIKPENAKALYRRGKAHLKIEDYENAEEDLKKAQKLEPNAACIENLLVKLEELFWWR